MCRWPRPSSFSRNATLAIVPINVESIIAQSARSTTNSRYPRSNISRANSLRLPLLRKLPLPPTFTHTVVPLTSTSLAESTVTLSHDTSPQSMLSSLAAHVKISHQLIRNAALNELHRIE